MTWDEFMAARQLLAEELVGARVRASVRGEDEGVGQSIAAMKRDGQHGAG